VNDVVGNREDKLRAALSAQRLGKLFSARQGALGLFAFACLSEASCDPCTYFTLASHPVKLLGCYL
jgi:hypothetical protein